MLAVNLDGEKMNQEFIVPKQFAIRLSPTLHEQFIDITNKTHMNKSEHMRLALQRHIRDINQFGVTKVIEACES